MRLSRTRVGDTAVYALVPGASAATEYIPEAGIAVVLAAITAATTTLDSTRHDWRRVNIVRPRPS